MIRLLRLVLFKLQIQRAMSVCIAGENHYAACDLIQAVNNKYSPP
jgi:hypothetical protein